jgi:DNA uptake protein ComE-like DNA-binding protein
MPTRHLPILLMIAVSLCACDSDDAPAAKLAQSAAPAATAAAETLSFTTAPLLDPNTASEQQLSSVKGLNPARVQAILSKRPFATPTELHAAISDGMSEQDQRSVYSAMFIRVNLNTAANDDFRLIPSSLSPRKLAHEFDEYRPYRSIDDFRREMSKYVSDEEVEFLARYVFVE